MLDELDALVAGEALASRLEHGLGKVKADTKRLVAIDPEKGEQAAVARPEVEDATNVARHMLEQDVLSLRATRILVGPAEITMNMLGGRPFLSGPAGDRLPAFENSLERREVG